jgi:glycosyltransferase involved in cell wall biosynthesis
VAFLTGDFNEIDGQLEPNGCAWYRLVLPSRELAKRGWDTGVGVPRANSEQGLGLAHKDGMLTGWDIYVLKLLMIEQIAPMMRGMQERGTRMVVDVDDFHFGLHEENIASRATDPHRNPTANRAFYEQSIREADTVIVSTAFLADFYETRVRDVRLVRNSLDIDRWTPIQQDEQPILGWVGGTLWRSGDVEILQDWLPGFVKDHEVRVHHAGHIPGDGQHFGARVGLQRVTTTPMCLVKDYPERMFDMNIGLVPLNRVPFSEAKSNLKGLEYAAKGIPFIATPTEEYRILYDSGVGRLAETPDEWRDHATELLDPDVRREEGARIRAIVEKEWTIGRKADEWATAIHG